MYFLWVKTYLALDHASSQKEAGDQMREKFLDLPSGTLFLNYML
jgi:hypothetical protein